MIKGFLRKKLTSLLEDEFQIEPVFRPYTIHPVIGDTSFSFIVPDKESAKWYDTGYQSMLPELRLLSAITRPDFNVLEIGLHNGFHSALFSKLLDNVKGRYLGIELMPGGYLSALAQLKLNEAGLNFQVMHAAAGNKKDQVCFNDIKSVNGSVNLEGTGIPVEQVTGDAQLEFFSHQVDLLKIDVEGYEAYVLEGCQHILSSQPNIALELHLDALHVYENTVADVLKFIDFSNYHALYSCNPNSGNRNARVDTAIKYFDPNRLPLVDNINLFLFSKKYFETLPIGIL